jgi:hypothetical protein
MKATARRVRNVFSVRAKAFPRTPLGAAFTVRGHERSGGAMQTLRCRGALISFVVMTKCAPLGRLFLLLFLAFSLIGCSQFKRGTVSEEKDPHYLEGKRRGASMDWDGAIESFERALQSNPTNAAAHFELGVLYDQRKNDFGAAIHHYQRHLKLRPESPRADMANTYIVACKRELAKSVSYALVPRDIQQDLERYARTNALQRQQIDALQAELARRPRYVTNYVTNSYMIPEFDPRNSARLTQPATMVPPVAMVEPEPAPAVVEPTPAPRTTARTPPPSNHGQPARANPARQPAPAGKTHRVRPGDTLEVVARRHGVSVRALKAANPSARNGARAGQVLVIPAR